MNVSLDSIQPSLTLAISAKAKELAAEGIRVCSFAAGEPDFDTPQIIKDAAIRAIGEGKTKYTAARGMPSLCKAVADKFLRENNLSYTPSQVIISSGGKQSLATAFLAMLNRGDEVLIPSPYWLSYPEMVRIAGGKPRFIKTRQSQHFKLTPEALEKAIRPKTVALVLNYPSNPTGVCYTADELRALGEVCVRHNLWIIADEMYERMNWSKVPFVSIASLSPEIKARTLTCNGVSKTYSMTGWRIGYAAGPEELIRAMTTVQSHCASNPATPSQYAALAALTQGEEAIQPMLKAFRERSALIYRRLRAIRGMRVMRPDGALYIFPNIKAFGLDSVTFCIRLLEEQHVACVPGAAFGAPDNIRLSYACSLENIEEGVARIAAFCDSLRASS